MTNSRQVVMKAVMAALLVALFVWGAQAHTAPITYKTIATEAEFHQAMMEVEDPTVPAGTVVQELAPGYLIAGRLLRAAMVAVSKGGPAVRSPSNEN